MKSFLRTRYLDSTKGLKLNFQLYGATAAQLEELKVSSKGLKRELGWVTSLNMLL
jgi:hypothetical protein